jgi:hypothetical protein
MDDFSEKLHTCQMQTEWIEEKIRKFGEKMDKTGDEKQKEMLEKEGLELLDLIQREINELNKLEDA